MMVISSNLQSAIFYQVRFFANRKRNLHQKNIGSIKGQESSFLKYCHVAASKLLLRLFVLESTSALLSSAFNMSHIITLFLSLILFPAMLSSGIFLCMLSSCSTCSIQFAFLLVMIFIKSLVPIFLSLVN